MEGQNYIKEKCLKDHAKSTSLSEQKTIIEQMEKSVCKIDINESVGTGFFCIIPYDDWNSLKVLMTNNHVLENKDIIPGKIIKFSLNNDLIKKEILIDKSRKTYTNKLYDVTIIEIKQNDGIEIDSFLEIDNQIFKKETNFFLNIPIYLLHYPKGIEIKKGDGTIKRIYEDNYTIEHFCDSETGSSGGPLINLKSFKIVGIHKGGHNKININLGTLLKLPIKDFKEKMKNNNVDENKKIIVNNEIKEKNYKEKIENKKINAFDDNNNYQDEIEKIFSGSYSNNNKAYTQKFMNKIIESLYKNNSNEKLDTVEKMQKLLNIIKPLLFSSEENLEENPYKHSIEQIELSKLIFAVKSQDPEVIYQIYKEIKNFFVELPTKKKIPLISLANCIIYFCHKLSLSYDNKNNLVSEEIKKNQYSLENINSIDISKINNDEKYYKFMLSLYKLLNETISLIAENSLITAFKLYLLSASQVNSIQYYRRNFVESCVSFIDAAIKIYNEGKYDENLKYYLLSDIVGYLLGFTILGNKNIENIIEILSKNIYKLDKRIVQCKSMLSISQLYYSKIKDQNKFNNYMKKVRRNADFCLTYPEGLVVFVELLNKLLYFIDKDNEIITIKAEQINEIIEFIPKYIEITKTDGGDISFLQPIESYFSNTLDIIKKRKKEEGHKAIYDSILNN